MYSNKKKFSFFISLIIFTLLLSNFGIVDTLASNKEAVDKTEIKSEKSEPKKKAKKKNKKKNKKKTKKNNSNKKKSKKNKKKSKKKKQKNKDYTQSNIDISDHLQQSLGWALGELDENGEATNNGTPDPNNAWAIFVTKIELSSDDEQLNIYVTPEFAELDDSSKLQVVNTAQNISMAYTGETKPLFTVIFDGVKTIGRSTITDVNNIKWEK